MEITESIQRGYITALSAIELPVYIHYAVPEKVEYPFILVKVDSVRQLETDNPCLAYEVYVTVDVITGHLSPLGNLDALGISEQVINIINPDSGESINLPGEWNIIGASTLRNSGTLESRSKNYWIYRVIKTFRQHVSKA